MDMKTFCEQYVALMGKPPFNRSTTVQLHRVVVEGEMPTSRFFTDDQMRSLLNGTTNRMVDGTIAPVAIMNPFTEPVVQIYAFVRDNAHLWLKDATDEPA